MLVTYFMMILIIVCSVFLNYLFMFLKSEGFMPV